MSRSLPTYLLGPGLLVVSAAFVAFACGGSDTPEDSPPACYAHIALPDAGVDGGGGAPMVRNVRATEWVDLVVRNYREGSTSTQNCVGDEIRWVPTDRACRVHEPDDEPAPQAQPLNEESVVVGRSDTVARKPVWVITHHFEDGDGFGPVMLGVRSPEGVAIRAIGTLRLPRTRARLRLRESGGQEFLVADGERCPPEPEESEEPPANVADGQPTGEEEREQGCMRYARILPLVGDQLMTPEVRNTDGDCLGSNQIWLQRERNIALVNGWERRFRLAGSMEFRGGAGGINEQGTIEDRAPRGPGRPARRVPTPGPPRVPRLSRGGMQSSGLPLFERALRAHGSTQLPIGESPDQPRPGQQGQAPRTGQPATPRTR